MSSSRQFIYTLGLSILIVVITVFILSRIPAEAWSSWQPASCLESGCFCEAVQDTESIRQPVNTWSSFAYVFVGVWIALGAALIVSGALYSRLHAYGLGVSALIIGLGSAFYHASLTFTGQFFDIFGMYLLAALMLVYSFQRLLGWTKTRAVLIYVVLNVGLSVVQIAIPDTRRYLFALVLVAALAVELFYYRRVKPSIEAKWFHFGLIAFAVAFAVWGLDSTRILCSPNSLLQGHAIWHMLGALAVVFLHRYYLSEMPKNA